MVPPRWEHPKKEVPNYIKGRMEERYQPMFGSSYTESGDFLDQQRRAMGMNCTPWSREAAERVVFGSGWAPSLIMTGGKIMSGVDDPA